MAVEYRERDSTYFERRKIDNQTIELGINFYDGSIHDRKSWWNIYITIFNKRKDMYTNMDKKVITGKNPFATVIAAREMFYNVEAYLLDHELVNGPYDEVTIFCTWVDNRRRDAYYKVLHRMGYDWGTVDKEKCIMKTYKLEDINPEVIEDEY
jgi:hypothetical protein